MDDIRHRRNIDNNIVLYDNILGLRATEMEKKAVTVDDLIQFICEELEITPEQLKSKRKTPNLVLARQLVVYCLREHFRYNNSRKNWEPEVTYQHIGTIINRNYATCIHAYHKLNEMLSFNGPEKGAYISICSYLLNDNETEELVNPYEQRKLNEQSKSETAAHIHVC